MSINRGRDKETMVHPHSGILLILEKEELSSSALSSMDLEDVVFREISQT